MRVDERKNEEGGWFEWVMGVETRRTRKDGK